MDQTVLLTKLQDLDLAITRGRKRLDDLPEKTAVLELRRRIREIGALRAKAEQMRDQVDRAVRASEDAASVLSEKIEREQSKMMSGEVTNPKEVQNLSRELASLQKQKEKVDSETIDLMEKREAADAQVAKVEAAITEGRSREEKAVRIFQEKGGEASAELGRLEAERKLVAAALPPDLLQRYETLREQKHGMGLGVLHDATCSACRVELPATKVQALRSGPPVGVCPACHRLLVVTPKESE